ncbi:hypothetical protein A2801_04270 [Candidatus Woesebacteria bacterium RIFCSPHIGHO2_01_FULL_41_10]|uniref:YibE/F family protein n=1 Tax=Candidatus Woesebacteria bacterium RIFCSPHIGHO2_01_FULL_41_10 TaxID=1802500 RepID=A0A1F7YLJ3_9BACT|nr:MAG: hypothetical protein A2801_04270 [Candidatus Woesebacteria bacterium RIFCSPHIGHO2_01_FULL_41_10]
MKGLFIGVWVIITIFIAPVEVLAQEYITSQFEAEVTEVLDEQIVESGNLSGIVQKLQVKAIDGELQGRMVVIEEGQFVRVDQPKYNVGDRLIITQISAPDGSSQFYITDYVRSEALIGLFVLFVLLTIIIGRFAGVASFIGMVYSFAVIFTVVLPLILRGVNPVLVAIGASLLIVPGTFYLSHGINQKTHVAVLGTIITLIITTGLAAVTVEVTHLTGFASEEAGFLQSQLGGNVNMKGLLLAGIIIGTLGVLDDITVSQASIVSELKTAARLKNPRKLYSSAMRVGRDHIASLVNTLVLVYTGASLPLLLLFINSDQTFGRVINLEIIADEVVRTLVGSIGLVLAVPITTALAVYWMKGEKDKTHSFHSH